MKTFSKLTDKQKVKVNERLTKTFNRIIRVIDFYGFIDNEEKKAKIFNDSIDIFYSEYPNLIDYQDFKKELKALFVASNKEHYINKNY